MYTRAHIRLMTNQDAINFVSLLNSDGSTRKYALEDYSGHHRVDARSLLGVLYFIAEHNDETYLANDDGTDDEFPKGIDAYRI